MKFLLTQDHMGLKISKYYSAYSFHPMPAKFYEDIGYHGGIHLLLFLTIGLVLNSLWHFEILTLESMGKPKM